MIECKICFEGWNFHFLACFQEHSYYFKSYDPIVDDEDTADKTDKTTLWSDSLFGGDRKWPDSKYNSWCVVVKNSAEKNKAQMLQGRGMVSIKWDRQGRFL